MGGQYPPPPQICLVLSCFLKELCLSLRWSMWVLEALCFIVHFSPYSAVSVVSLTPAQSPLSHPSSSSLFNLYISLFIVQSTWCLPPPHSPSPCPSCNAPRNPPNPPGPAPSLSPQALVGKAVPFLRDPPQPCSCALGYKEWRSGRALPVLP